MNRNTVVWLITFLVLLYLYSSMLQGPERQEISYTQFKQDVTADQIASVTIQGETIRGQYRSGDATGETTQAFTTTKPAVEDPRLLDLLESHNVDISAESTSTQWWQTMLIMLLPWLLLIGFFVYSSRLMQRRLGGGGGDGGGPFNFGKSKAQLYKRTSEDVHFGDVAGSESAKRDLQEIIDYLKNPGRFHDIGAKMPKGILLMGPPGTGKTLLARAVAGEADVPFFSISGSEFIEMFVGVGASRVRNMFQDARKQSPALIFIDEIDSVGRTRGTGLGGGHDEREQTLNQILNEMDGFSTTEPVVVLAATNRPDVLDPALLRPGRFDRKVTLELPQRKARQEILKVHTRHVPLAEDVDLEQVAGGTVGFSGADLENLVNEAALLAGRKEAEKVSQEDFDEARDKIILGAERDELSNEAERERIAYHEAGHALTAYYMPEADPLKKVTIIPRGQALGATEQVPKEDWHNYTQGYLESRISVMLGGRASERLVYNEVSSGAADDLKQTTRLARMMVSQWGMSERLGPVSFREGEEHPFLGREMAGPKDHSEHTAQLIDEEIKHLVDEREAATVELLKKHRSELEALAQALLEQETLEEDAIEKVLENAQKATA